MTDDEEARVQHRIAEMTPAPGQINRWFDELTRRNKEHDQRILRAAGIPEYVPIYGDTPNSENKNKNDDQRINKPLTHSDGGRGGMSEKDKQRTSGQG